MVTSSVAAILNTLPHPAVFDETSWNTTAVEECETKGKDASPFAKYRASKTLAERAAWDFVEKYKSSLKFDLVVINPPFVYGPILHEVDKPENLNTSMLDWYNTVIKATKDDATLVAGGYAVSAKHSMHTSDPTQPLGALGSTCATAPGLMFSLCRRRTRADNGGLCPRDNGTGKTGVSFLAPMHAQGLEADNRSQ